MNWHESNTLCTADAISSLSATYCAFGFAIGIAKTRTPLRRRYTKQYYPAFQDELSNRKQPALLALRLMLTLLDDSRSMRLPAIRRLGN
jgi:hypothetical protein